MGHEILLERGKGSSANTLLRNSSGRKIERAIGRIFTGFMRNSEPPATDVVMWVFGASNLGSSA
jgi:hypothetical protein